MPVPQFDIVFRGVRNGFDSSLVKAQFATLFKLDSATVERIFKSSRVTLKNNANERVANIFVARLFAIGVIADKCPVEPLISNAINSNARTSKAIILQDAGETSPEASAMHQPVEFLYGEHIRRIPFVFSGNGFDYCKVWLVNLLVCLLSAGVLYPWAQVRSLRYFYQHTELDNAAFDYSSNPQKIYLIQFSLIVYGLCLLYTFFHHPIYCLLGLLVLIGVLPFYWFQRSTFQARHSLYRHLTFRQDASLRDTYVNFLGWPLAILLTAGVASPYAVFKMQKYWATKKYFSDYQFSFAGNIKNYFALLPPLLIAEAVTFACVFWSQHLPFWFSVLLVFAVWLLVFVRWRVALVNLQWNGAASKLGYFVANWDLPSYRKLAAQNICLCILTLGFYWPWARVRSAHYKASHLAFFANQRFKKWQHSLD
jgi:uncharacterized membrane protein YjgN (DUF898 family)